MTVTIDIKLFATLSRFLPESSDCYEMPAGGTIRDLLARLHIPEEKARLIFVNGRRAELASKPKNGDRVGIFPPVGGG